MQKDKLIHIAKDVLLKHIPNGCINTKSYKQEVELIENAMIEFAKLHVIESLKCADNSATNQFSEKEWLLVDDKNFIINSYPLSNIK